MSVALVLRELGLVEPDVLELAALRAPREGTTLVHVLARDGHIDDELLARLLAVQLKLERIDLDTRQIDPRVTALLPAVLARRFRVVPVGVRRTREGDVLYGAMSSPDDDLAFMEVQAATGLRLSPLVAADGAISRALASSYGDDDMAAGALTLRPSIDVARALDELPLVVGDPTDDDREASFDDILIAPPRLATNRFDGPPVTSLTDEWLVSSTKQVLAAHAPLLSADVVETARLTPKRASSRAQPVPLVDTSALVAADIGLRAWLSSRLRHAIPDLYDFARLEDVAEFAASGALAHLVLVDPPADTRLVEILAAIADGPAPPEVVVVTTNRAFEVMRGVSRRLDPRGDDEQLAIALLATLYGGEPHG